MQLQRFSIFFHIYFTAFVCLCGLMRAVSECAAALPMVERVGLVTGDLRVLGGVGEADLPEKKDRPRGYQLGQEPGALRSTVSTNIIFSYALKLVTTNVQ